MTGSNAFDTNALYYRLETIQASGRIYDYDTRTEGGWAVVNRLVVTGWWIRPGPGGWQHYKVIFDVRITLK